MEHSTIAIIIIVVALVLYATEIIPILVTSILAVAAMILTGILDPTQAFSGFSNVATLLAGAAMVLGIALGETGATEWISQKLNRMTNMNKRNFNTLLCGLSALLSACLSSFGIIVIMMTVVDSIIVKSNHKFNKRESYMPIAVGASIGGAISLSGSSSVLTACAAYNQYVGYEAISYFGPAILGIPATLGAMLFYFTFGTKLSEKWFDFEETPVQATASELTEGDGGSRKKMYISMVTFLCCALLWALTDLNLALVGMLGTCVLFLTKVVKPDTVLAKVNWASLIILACTLGFAAGVHESGADMVIADFVLGIAGPLGESSTGMFLVILLLTIILTNIMSNTGAAAIVAPIAIAIAETMGSDAMLWCIAIGVGANCAVATPIGCANMTILLPAGYRFKDFVKVGTMVCILSSIFMLITYVLVA